MRSNHVKFDFIGVRAFFLDTAEMLQGTLFSFGLGDFRVLCEKVLDRGLLCGSTYNGA